MCAPSPLNSLIGIISVQEDSSSQLSTYRYKYVIIIIFSFSFCQPSPNYTYTGDLSPHIYPSNHPPHSMHKIASSTIAGTRSASTPPPQPLVIHGYCIHIHKAHAYHLCLSNNSRDFRPPFLLSSNEETGQDRQGWKAGSGLVSVLCIL